MRVNSRLIHGHGPAADHGVIPAIQLSSTFLQPTDGTEGPFAYQRGGNPTRAAAETLLAAVEDAAHAQVYSTGMAALTAVFSLVKPGEKVLLTDNVYGGTYRYATNFLPHYGIDYEFVADFNALTAEDVDENVSLIIVETPSNPVLRIVDIAHVVSLARGVGARVAVDNTFMTPLLQKPLELGADLSVYSATKYLGGHADLLAGAVLTNDAALHEQLRFQSNTFGSPLAPFDCYSLIRGVKTLDVRLQRQQENTHRVIDFLTQSPHIAAVHYPGSHSAEEKAIHERQARGLGAVVSFELAPGIDRETFLANLGFIGYAVSLGGVESLVCSPAFQTHESFTPEDRARAGITDTLLRFAVGIEDGQDLVETLAGAIDVAKQ